MDDPDFLDFMMEGGDELLNTEVCPHCGTCVPHSLFFDNVVECSECGKKFRKGENG